MYEISRNEIMVILPATESDSSDIFEWRNDEMSIQMSLTNLGVSWETHCIWYEKYLANSRQYMYIGKLPDGEKIGVCRFDLNDNNNDAEVSINLNPKHRGKKLSSLLLSEAVAAFLEKYNINLSATIRKSNIGSIKCFMNNEFEFDHEDENCNFYKRVVKSSSLMKIIG